MIDQSHINLLNLIPAELKFSAQTNGGEYHGACPFCGQGTDRFCVWPNHPGGGRWWCRQCGKQGDALGFLMQYKGLDFKAACEELRCIMPDSPGNPGQHARSLLPEIPASDLKDYPCFHPAWQSAAHAFCEDAADRLYTHWNGTAGAYLERRGISKSTAVNAWLGLNLDSYHAVWGDVEVYLPRGIVIPWVMDKGVIWNVRVRRPKGDLDANPKLSKYVSVKGWANGIYGLSRVRFGDTVYMTEGEFDALVLSAYLQKSGTDSDSVVSIGTNTGGRIVRLITQLGMAERVYLCFDDDGKSEGAFEYWFGALYPRARRLRPTQKDITEMYLSGELSLWIRHEGE